jgi:GTP-binding protein
MNLPDLFTKPLPLVAIVGRPNVGKSTLFNRILGSRTAIVDDVPGVTRDRNYADGIYRGRPFRLVDTGGLEPGARDGMFALIKQQSELAIAEADILILLVDGRAGLTPVDQELADLLRRTTKPVFVAVNKVDTPQSEPLVADFYQLGQEVFPVSAEHGLGVSELLDAVYPLLPSSGTDGAPEKPRIAIIGRPNVGKSTMINGLVGQTRVVVSDEPGTTRDSIDTAISHDGNEYILTDTAGIRRRGRIERGIEGYSVMRALKAMGRSDIAVLVLDAEAGITEQDTKIAGLILKQGRACIVVVNKWDLREAEPQARKAFLLELRRRFPFLAWAPVLFGSALKPDSVNQLFPVIDRVMAEFTKRVPTGLLNKFLQEVIAENPIPVRKGRPAKARKAVFMTQVATRPPVFALFVGQPGDLTKTYLRFLENRLRKQYDFSGCLIRILPRAK